MKKSEREKVRMKYNNKCAYLNWERGGPSLL